MPSALAPAHGLLPKPLTAAILAAFASAASAQTLSDDVTQLEDVVVTASGFEQNVTDAPASISVIPREKLEQGTYRDLNDALRDVPGVIITPNGDNNGRGDISIRGMGAQYTLILVDGKRTNTRETQTNGSTGTDQSWMPPLEAIERIEVVRGPMSSLYGSDAMGGVVNIITRKVANEWTGAARAEATIQQHSRSGDAHQGNFYLSGPIKQDMLGLSIYGNYGHRDEDDIVEGYNKAKNHSGTVKLSLTPTQDHDITAEAETGKQVFEARAGKSLALDEDDSFREFKRERYALTHNGRWTQHLLSDTYVQREKTRSLSRHMEIKNTVANTSWTYAFDRHTAVAGAYYEENDLTDTTTNTISDLSTGDRWQYAFFIEDEWRMTDAFALTAGLRYDKVKKAGDHWSPRIYGVYHLNDNWALKGGVSTGFRAPNIRQTISDWGATSMGGDIYGNPDLTPEKSVTKEIGVVYNGNQGMQASLMLFDTDFKDKITRIPCPECGPVNRFGASPTTYVNVDEAVTRGVEASLSTPLSETVMLNTSYTYTYSKQKTGEYAGQPLNKLPKHLFNLGVDWEATSQIRAWARLQFRGKESEPTGGRSASTIVSPSTTFLDLGGSYKFNKNTTLHAGIYNVFDKTVTDYDEYGYIEDGRRFWLAMDVKF